MRTSRASWLAVVVLVLSTAVLPAGTLAASPPATAFGFGYDDLGRLVEASDPSSVTAVYRWDSVGNVLGIARSSSATVTVSQLAPQSGAVGSTVRIYGSGFSAIASQDTVMVNGTQATVSSALPSELVVTVPAGAASGAVTVTAPGGSASSASPFTVSSRNGPTIGSVGQTIATAGTALTVTGSNFDTTTANDALVVNRTRAALSAATSGSLTAAVPGGAGSGAVKVATVNGLAAGPDLYVPPPGFSASSVAFTQRVTLGGSSQVASLGAAGQVAMVIFNAKAGHRLFVSGTVTGGASDVSLYDPYNDQIVKPVKFSSGSDFIDTLTVPTTGTYTLLAAAESAGTVTLTPYDVPGDFTATTTPSSSGDSVNVSTTVPGQDASITFSGTAGERIFIDSQNWNYTNEVDVSVSNPDGSTLQGSTKFCGDCGNYIDTLTLAQTGTYKMYLDVAGAGTGSMTLTTYQVPADFSGSTSPSASGDSVNVSTTVPGQNAQLTFSGTAGGRIFFDVSAWSGYGTEVDISVLNPDGSTLQGSTKFCNTCGNYIDALTLAQTGTYKIFLNPAGTATGSLTATSYQVPADFSGTMSIGGSPVVVTTTTPGQNGALTFAGTSGKGVHLIAGSDTISSAKLSILNPNGSTLASSTLGTNGGTISTTLGTTGTFTAFVDPQAAATGSVTLTLTDPLASPAQIARAKRLYALSVKRRAASLRAHRSARRTNRTARAGARRARRARRSHRRHRAGGGGPVGPLVRFSTANAPFWAPTRRNLTGDWSTGRVSTPWATLPPLFAGPRVTAVAGQALRLNGLPLARAQISIEGTRVRARTDVSGRFLLSRVPAGNRVLDVDGTTTVRGRGPRFGSFEIGVNVVNGRTSVLPFTVWMPQLDPADTVEVGSPTRHAVTLTTPHIPGLQVRIPAGSMITGADGKPVSHLSIVPVPVDRPPFPLPLGSYFPVYISVQPAGAYVSSGAEIIYPNYSHLPAGQRVPFWNYDPGKRGWYIYGQGTVSRDGKHIVPDPGVRVWRFSGAMISGSLIPPWLKNFFEGLVGADPVNLGSGLFTYRKTDLELPDVLPIALTRVYRPADNNSYSFGIGTTNSYDLRLFSQNNYQTTELILPDGMDVHYVRTSQGTSWTDAVYRATSTPTEFYASTISWNGNGWNLRLRNGVTYVFPSDVSYGVIAIRDRYGNQVSIARDSAGNITQVTSPNGRWISFQHDANNRITQATDNSGRTVRYDYNGQTGGFACSNTTSTGPSGTLRCVKDAGGGETYYTYDPSSGWMTQITDARGNVFLTNIYDANGRVTQQTLANDTSPCKFSYQLNGSGLVTQSTMTSPNGNQTISKLDANGFPSSVTVAAGTSVAQATNYTRQAGTNFLTAETDQLGRQTRFGYDSLGNLSQVTQDATGSSPRTTKIVYDPTFSQPTQVTDPGQHATVYGYDSAGELTSVTDPRLNQTTIGYANGDGQPTSITDAYQKATSYGYVFGDRDSVTDPDGNTASWWLDAGGREVQATDPVGNTTSYGYDPLNDPTTVTDPDGHQTKYGYDADGNLSTITDPNTHQTILGYDNQDRLHTRQDALGNTWTYNYDHDNNLTSVQDPKGQTITYTPDALDRVSTATFKTSTGATQSTINYTYDAGNRLQQAVDSAGGAFTDTWDPFDELTGETGPYGTITYSYNPDGTRASFAATGQGQVNYAYNPDSRPTSVSNTVQTASLSYDNDGRPQTLTLPAGITQNYTYDPASRLTDLTYSNTTGTLGDLHYAYDPDGNRTQQWGSYARLTIPPAWGSSPVYNADNQLTSNGATSYSYDHDGNLTNDTANTYGWNARGQLTQITGANNASFGYDPFGRREQQTQTNPTTGQPTTTGYLYDGANVVQELTQTAAGNLPTANYLLGLGINQRYSRTGTDTTNAQSYLTDALGSTIALADPTGSIQTTYTYDPFGQATATNQPTQTSQNPYQYTGQENDGTGLQYNRNRYYSPALGRFISQDPAGLAGSGTNLYAYTNDNPTNQTDPTGLSSIPNAPGLCLANVLSGAKNGAAAWGCGASTLLAGILGWERILGEGAAQATEEGTNVFRAGEAAGGGGISLDQAAAAASRHGIDMRMFDLQYEPGPNFGFMSQTGSGALVRGAGGRIALTLQDAGLASEQDAVETIAHELNHVRGVLNNGFVTDEPTAEAAAQAAGRYFR